MNITGHTRMLGLVGSPVDHSGSPAMYNYAFELLDIDYAYLAFDVKGDQVEQAVNAIRTFNLRGFNCTMPLKKAILPYIDEKTPAVELIGATNTVVNEDGKLVAYNTDGVGYVLGLKANGVDIAGKKMVLFGAGGAGTAILVQCALSGAAEIAVVESFEKSYEETVERAKRIMEVAPQCKIEVVREATADWLKEKLAAADILANATPCGMHPNEDTCALEDLSLLHSGLIVTDAVYNPQATKLILAAEAAGCKTMRGKTMLLWQGVEAFRLYTGKDMPVDQVREKFFT